MIDMTTSLLNNSFLAEFIAIDVDRMESEDSLGTPAANRAVSDSLESGLLSIKQSNDGESDAVAMSIPVYKSGSIRSLAVFVGKADAIGVMEIWQPIGEHDELNLTQGYFGPLERFQNVSSFVRFEKGSGLPGQVWREQTAVIHDNLPSHPGFLRAAGASAESLQVAIGLPVASDDFLASALLISADASPIARGYEVWRCGDQHYELESAAYQRLDKTLTMDEGAVLTGELSLPHLAVQTGVVCTSDDPAVVYCGRPYREDGVCKGMAIPFYEGDRVTSVLALLL